MNAPKLYQSIMLSSTFTDLTAHRQYAIKAIDSQRFKPEVSEFGGAVSDYDFVGDSLEMVRNAAAYIGIIGHKYGQTPDSAELNPDGLSITELEFNEAMRLNRPILLFIMSDNHPLKRSDLETDIGKRKKLAAFRQRAKLMPPVGKGQRIYQMFDSVDDFAKKAADAIALLTRDLASRPPTIPPPPPAISDAAFPLPPALRAMPQYRGSHNFVGRAAQLDTLNEWASPANQNPLLLFAAMGGSGKSMLTWHWTTKCAEAVRDDWAGRFWYSFYEKGAAMADFCRQALAYMTSKSPSAFAQLPQSKLSEQLLAQLNAKPWLLVLDGLERVLVAYRNSDVRQMRDENVDDATDPMGNREAHSAIWWEDDELLKALAGAQPSRILVSTRLTPLSLLSVSGTPIMGARIERLPGLRPEDAESMMRACGITGDGEAIRAYLQRNCDCHPLVTGVIAGLINKNVQAPGNFDKWVKDPNGGGALNLGALDLVQRRNHILSQAIEGVDEDERHVLNLLSLFPRIADYDVLLELATTNDALDEGRMVMALARLRDRGLIQYDWDADGYDLHPVVRGVVAGRMDEATTGTVGDALIDHFAAVPHNPWEQARTLDDVQSGIDVVATLQRMGRYQDAYDAFSSDLVNALMFNLEAYAEMQQLLLPFFPDGWAGASVPLFDFDEGYLLGVAALAVQHDRRDQANLLFERAIRIDLETEDIQTLQVNISNLLSSRPRVAADLRLQQLASEVADLCDNPEQSFGSKFELYKLHVDFGDPREVERQWRKIDILGRDWSRSFYRPGELEFYRALHLFYQCRLDEGTLAIAEELADVGHNRQTQRDVHRLRGLWQLDQSDFPAAVASLEAAILMAHERRREDHECEAWRALAQSRADAVDEVHAMAEQLGEVEEAGAVALAELWNELGDHDRALAHARCAHAWAAQAGEPYVRRYWLNRIRALYAKMGVEPPAVPVYDPAAHPPFAWEADVRALIEKKKAERAAREGE